MAKLMILAGLVFRKQLLPEQVARRGITDLAPKAIEEASSAGGRLKHVATLEFSRADGGGDLVARVEPMLVRPDDPLIGIEGVTNAVVCQQSRSATSPSSGPVRDRRSQDRAC